MGPFAERKLTHTGLGSASALLAIAVHVFLGASDAGSVEDAASRSAAFVLDATFSNLYADDYIQTLTLTTIGRSGDSMQRKLQITRRQSERPGKALVRFLEPYAIRRTSILILEKEEGPDELFVYLPAARMTRRLSMAQKADLFFGTDLCFEDIEPKRASDYDVHWIEAGRGDGDCDRMAATVREGLESVYERMVYCIERDRDVIRWAEFERAGSVVRRLDVDPESVQKVGDRLIPFEMKMSMPGRGSSTRISTGTYDIRPTIPEALFSTWNLEVGTANRDRREVGKSSD